MKIAIIGDIHGNKYALKSVLADIKKKNVDFIISTGDLVGYMSYPNEVIELMKENRVIVVQGNHDKVIAESKPISDEQIENLSDQEIQQKASAAFTNWCINEENRKYLKNLVTRLTMECNGYRILVVHGSPTEIDEYLYENEEVFKELSKKVTEDIIICGHTHIPYVREINNKYFINAGSVGKPKHGDWRSTYVVMEIIENNVCCKIEKIEYDLDAMVQDIKNNRMISNNLITMLQQGI